MEPSNFLVTFLASIFCGVLGSVITTYIRNKFERDMAKQERAHSVKLPLYIDYLGSLSSSGEIDRDLEYQIQKLTVVASKEILKINKKLLSTITERRSPGFPLDPDVERDYYDKITEEKRKLVIAMRKDLGIEDVVDVSIFEGFHRTDNSIFYGEEGYG